MYLLCSLKGRWHFLLQTITRISFFSPQTTTLTSFPILKFRCQFTLSIPALSKSTVELDAKVRQITKLPLTNMLSFYICLYKNTLIFYAGNQHKMYFKMKLMSFLKKKNIYDSFLMTWQFTHCTYFSIYLKVDLDKEGKLTPKLQNDELY